MNEYSKIANITKTLMDKIAEIYTTEMNGNFAKPLLALLLRLKYLRCPTDLPMLCFN